MDEEGKYCTQCRVYQPLTQFRKHNNKTDGRTKICNTCTTANKTATQQWRQEALQCQEVEIKRQQEEQERRQQEASNNLLLLPTQARGYGGWLRAHCEYPGYPSDHESRSGKWLVFLSAQSIDYYWRLVMLSLAMFRLGRSAKVCTHQPPGKDYVICVYTYDYADLIDVKRMRRELYNIGIKRPISYKADEQTRKGEYGQSWREQFAGSPYFKNELANAKRFESVYYF